MKQPATAPAQSLAQKLASPAWYKQHWFVWATLLAFALQAVWLAWHSAYPMAFDEGYHLQIIQFFSTRLNPIITQQDPSTYGLGNLVQNTSWLYHYLMSYAYQLLALSGSLRIEVIGLRFINIGIMIGALLVLYRLLGALGMRGIARGLVVLLVAFTPEVTVLAAHINYDSLVLLLTLLACHYMVRFIRELRLGTPTITTAGMLLIISSFGLLSKFSFLPIFAGILLVTGTYWLLAVRRRTRPLQALLQSWQQTTTGTRVGLAVGLAVGMGIAVGLYGHGLVRYHNLTPSCDQVLSVEACSNYYAWNRNYTLAQQRPAVLQLDGPVAYTYHWVVEWWYQLHAAIIPGGGIAHIARSFYALLLATSTIAIVVSTLMARRVIRAYTLIVPLLGVSAVYMIGLWLRNFSDYRHLGEAVGVQGRYIIPILAFYYTYLVLGAREAIQAWVKPAFVLHAQRALVIYVVVLFVWFGGAVRYISVVLPQHTWQTQASTTNSYRSIA